MTAPEGPSTTGRHLVLFEDGADAEGVRALEREGGLRVATGPDALRADAPRQADALVFDRLGVAVIDAPPDRVEAIRRAPAVALVEPERVVYALEGEAVDESQLTWGLQAIAAPTSPFTGRGVRVAVLDTGLDTGHPDFAGRAVTGRSFVAGAPVQDGNGHGTHCIGTACGPREPGEPPRYGIATESDIFAGKVLGDDGAGAEGSIVAGIEWALAQGCRIASMSLGSPVAPGTPHSALFERLASRAVAGNTALIAAAGNDSERNAGRVAPVAHPANCPSVLAVGALDGDLRIAPFSNQGTDLPGGQIDFAAPGVDVHSSYPMPRRYRRLSGTSMATPHVAGAAALHLEANPDATARELPALLMRSARRLPLPGVDVGAGLVQCPQQP